ncbi:MAG: MCE family protein [Solirubrobacterales bacterium]|nr:MCE family protein [Solirubrobacterales bacterium]
MKTRHQSRISSNPALIGAVTIVIIVVGIFYSYNANNGLPYVPTYDVKAELPNGASIVQGNEVRIAGVRVGVVGDVKAGQLDSGETFADLTLKIDKSYEPIPDNSTITVRQRSALGLKYLLLTPGDSDEGLPPGGTITLSQFTPQVVDQDDVWNMFQPSVRRAIQKDLLEYGGMFAARGSAINRILGQLPPLLKLAKPVTRNLASDETDLDGFINGLAQAAAEVAPVAQQQADQYVVLDTTFSALAAVARPYIQDSITEGYKSELVTLREGPRIRPFLYSSARFMRALLPGARALGESAPVVNRSFDIGIPVLRNSPKLNDQLAPTARSLKLFGESTSNNAGIDALIDTEDILEPLLSHVAPAQNVCNYLALLLRNAQEFSSTGNSTGLWARVVTVLPPPGPNGLGNPSAAPANGPGVNYLRYNPYPNTASPGQTRECEAGNEPTTLPANQIIGNFPGNQGIMTNLQSQEQLNWGK